MRSVLFSHSLLPWLPKLRPVVKTVVLDLLTSVASIAKRTIVGLLAITKPHLGREQKKVQIIQATQQDFPLPLLFLALHTPLGRSWPVFSYLDSAKIRCYHLSSPVQFTWQVPSQRGWAVLASPQPHQTYRPCFSTFSLCGFKSYLSRFCLRNFWEIWNLKSTHMSPLSGRGAFIPATSLTGFENLEVTCQKVGLFWEGGQT